MRESPFGEHREPWWRCWGCWETILIAAAVLTLVGLVLFSKLA